MSANKIIRMAKSPATTLEDAILWVNENSENGCLCPCCDQLSKIYKRKLNSGMAYELIALYRITLSEGKGEYIHHSRFSKTTGGEISKLRYWGLVTEKVKNDDKKTRTSGYWSITERGIDFILKKIFVNSHIILHDAKFIGFSDTTTNIVESLGKRFDYEKLMLNLD